MMRLLHDRRGVAALETALVVSFLLLPLLSALAGAGQALMTQSRLDRALHAALIHAWGNPVESVANLQQAAQLGYGGDGPAMTPTVAISCYCVTASTGARANTAIACNATCGSGQVLGTYATVTASASFTPIMTVNWSSGAWNLSASGTARVQ